jgi:hypothetical protein
MHRDPVAATNGAFALIVLAPWPDGLSLSGVVDVMARPLVFDGGNHLDGNAAALSGFEYYGVGR